MDKFIYFIVYIIMMGTGEGFVENLARKLGGEKTVSAICAELGVGRQTAINYISMLRQNGFVHKTKYTKPERTYVIKNYRKPQSGTGLVETLNKVLPADLQIEEPYEHYVWEPYSFEEALVDAVRTKKARFLLASLLLFRKTRDWKLLLKLAGKDKRKVGAVYDVARKELPRIRRMDKRSYNALLRAKNYDKYLVARVGASRDYEKISRRWGVLIPFTKRDLERIR